MFQDIVYVRKGLCTWLLDSKGLNDLYFALKFVLKDLGIYTRTYVWQGLFTPLLYSKGLKYLYFALLKD